MLDMLKRHAIQVLRQAGHSLPEVAKLAGVSVRSVQRVEDEGAVSSIDNEAERTRRKIGRPSKAEPFRSFVVEQLTKEPELISLEILRRARLDGYTGGKSALYELIHAVRPKPVRLITRFEGLPGEFSQHDFGQVDVRFLDGTTRRVHFFASRLKYSRWTEVSIVPNEQVETLVRALVDHFASIGGIPLLAVFDRPKTIAKSWGRDGEVTEWNPTFAGVALDLGLGIELCWPYSPEQKGSVENLVKWVKGSFFKPRRFLDEEDLLRQLRRVARGGEHPAAVAGHECHPRGTHAGGAAAAATAQGRTGRAGPAHPDHGRTDRDGHPRDAQLLDAAGLARHSRHAVPVSRSRPDRGRPLRGRSIRASSETRPASRRCPSIALSAWRRLPASGPSATCSASICSRSAVSRWST